METERDDAGVRFPPPLIYLGFLLVGIGAEWFVPVRRLGLDWTWRIVIGDLVAFAGIILIGSAIRLFRRSGTTPEPWTSTSAIVTAGIYRYTRNPMYLGLALIYAGLALAIDAPIALLLLPIVLVIVQTQVIAREERYLAAKFGEPYLDYKRRVRRWL